MPVNVVAAHDALATVLAKQPLMQAGIELLDDGSEQLVRQPNYRVIGQLPYHLLHAGRVAEAAKLVTALPFVDAKCTSNMLHDLLLDLEGCRAQLAKDAALKPDVEAMRLLLRNVLPLLRYDVRASYTYPRPSLYCSLGVMCRPLRY